MLSSSLASSILSFALSTDFTGHANTRTSCRPLFYCLSLFHRYYHYRSLRPLFQSLFHPSYSYSFPSILYSIIHFSFFVYSIIRSLTRVPADTNSHALFRPFYNSLSFFVHSIIRTITIVSMPWEYSCSFSFILSFFFFVHSIIRPISRVHRSHENSFSCSFIL